MHVLWKVGDGLANDLELADQGTAWSAAIPVQPDGTVVSFAVDITLDDGTRRSLPDNPADPMYQAFIGDATPIWCEAFDHDPMWTRSGTAPAEWQWARPTTAGRVSGDPSVTHAGTYIYGTNLAQDGAYGAGETTAVETPTIDASAFQIIHLQYWRWLTVEDRQLDQASIVASTDTIWHNATNSAGTLAHVDREWRFHDIDLTPHLYYGNVSVTWQLATDGTGERGGWNLTTCASSAWRRSRAAATASSTSASSATTATRSRGTAARTPASTSCPPAGAAAVARRAVVPAPACWPSASRSSACAAVAASSPGESAHANASQRAEVGFSRRGAPPQQRSSRFAFSASAS